MARTWINTNNKQGNVLKMSADELPAISQIYRPAGNMSFARLLDTPGDLTITIDGSKSLPGDELNILIQATAATVVTIAGDAAPGSVTVGAGGVGAVKLVNGGTNGNPLFASYVPLS